MTVVTDEAQARASEEALLMPIEAIDPGTPEYFVQDTIGHYFARLRRDDPVHFCNSPIWGPYWSVTRFDDIMHVDTHHEVFSSDWSNGGITLFNSPAVEDRLQMFIAMDPPEHERQRSAISPIFAPGNLAKMGDLIRERTCTVLDRLPRGETFNWVDHVSIELTTLMLATLFDFPVEDRHLLAHWSDVFTSYKVADPNAPSDDEKRAELERMLVYFQRLWTASAKNDPKHDLVSMLTHNPETRNMSSRALMGNLVLLIVGGNDTTRHSMSGGLLALAENPHEWSKLRTNPALIETLVPEIIRWQTPLAHMRRTTVEDVELRGKKIKAGEKVVMWYISGNRDEHAIADANRFIIDRPRARQHLSFGFGIHRCLGNRLAEIQLRTLWEEILKRFPLIEIMAPPVRLRSAFVRGFKELLVRIPA
jgi:cytochrome P450